MRIVQRSAKPELACENTRLNQYISESSLMDAEQINSIGSHLVDLTARTLDLRGYL